MLLIFVDETCDSKFKDYFGLSVATINYTKYAKVKTEFQKILKKVSGMRTLNLRAPAYFQQNLVIHPWMFQNELKSREK